MSSETKSRSLIKAISYRAVSSLVTAGIVFSVTQLGWLAIVVALFDSVVKTVTYFLHERIWTFIKFGRIRHPLEDLQICKDLTDLDKQTLRLTLSQMGLTEERSS